MDSHYDQVMKARSTADTAAMKLYFAYSTILDRAAFEEWRAQHSYEFFELPEGKLAEALDAEAFGMTSCRDTEDHREALQSWFEKRPAQFQGR